MGFIAYNNINIKPYKTYKNFYPLMKTTNNIEKQFNPLIGSNLGIPLNLLQFLLTYNYYNENIINSQLILLQIAIGIFTYGTDRLFDAYEYNQTLTNNINITEIYSTNKIDYYDYVLKNFDFSLYTIIASYIYTIGLLLQNENSFPIISLLTSTLFYREFKKNFGQFKAIYIGIFWTIGCIITPCVLHDHSYEILNHPLNYIPCFLTMFGSSNLLDIKDINEDKNDQIYTLPVLYGENNAIMISNFAVLMSIILFFNTENFYDTILVSSIYQIQNFATFFINYNNTV